MSRLLAVFDLGTMPYGDALSLQRRLAEDRLAGRLHDDLLLFAGGVGRTDFRRGDARSMRASIARLAGLPPRTVVHTGHGPDTTIERESRTNSQVEASAIACGQPERVAQYRACR